MMQNPYHQWCFDPNCPDRAEGCCLRCALPLCAAHLPEPDCTHRGWRGGYEQVVAMDPEAAATMVPTHQKPLAEIWQRLFGDRPMVDLDALIADAARRFGPGAVGEERTMTAFGTGRDHTVDDTLGSEKRAAVPKNKQTVSLNTYRKRMGRRLGRDIGPDEIVFIALDDLMESEPVRPVCCPVCEKRIAFAGSAALSGERAGITGRLFFPGIGVHRVLAHHPVTFAPICNGCSRALRRETVGA